MIISEIKRFECPVLNKQKIALRRFFVFQCGFGTSIDVKALNHEGVFLSSWG